MLWWEIKKGKTLSWIFFLYAHSFFHVYTTFYFMFWWETNQGYADVFRILNVPTPTDASKEYYPISLCYAHSLSRSNVYTTFSWRFGIPFRSCVYTTHPRPRVTSTRGVARTLTRPAWSPNFAFIVYLFLFFWWVHPYSVSRLQTHDTFNTSKEYTIHFIVSTTNYYVHTT